MVENLANSFCCTSCQFLANNPNFQIPEKLVFGRIFIILGALKNSNSRSFFTFTMMKIWLLIEMMIIHFRVIKSCVVYFMMYGKLLDAFISNYHIGSLSCTLLVICCNKDSIDTSRYVYISTLLCNTNLWFVSKFMGINHIIEQMKYISYSMVKHMMNC